MRSRSRWNSVRTPHASSGRSRPRVSNERTANGDSDSSSARMRSSKALLGARKASTGLRVEARPERRSHDDRHGAPVRAPGGAGHVRRALGAEEDDHGCDLLRLRKPAERPSANASGAVKARISCLEIAGDPATVSAWLGEPDAHPLDEIEVRWVPGEPGVTAVHFATPHGSVRVD